MIRGLSVFITILFLAGSAEALNKFKFVETGEILQRLNNGDLVLKDPQFTKFGFSYGNFVLTPRSYELDYIPVREDVTVYTNFKFEYNTDDYCDPLVLIGCEQFSTFIKLDHDPSPIPSAQNGFEVDFAHEVGTIEGASDVIRTDGKLVFSVTEEVTYTLSALYDILGDNIDYATMHLDFYEARRGTHPVDRFNVMAEYEWFPLVKVHQYVQEGPYTDVRFDFPSEVACDGCFEVGTDFTGILVPGNYYSLSWATTMYFAHGSDYDTVFPSGGVSLVVPEPSSNLMVCAGILGLAFLGRRRAKVS